jgi:hypothetical protein
MQVGWKMALERPFFEKYVWWWRPLCDILGPKHQDTGIPPDKLRGYFPPEMFTIIRHAEDMHTIPALLEEWIIQELDARLANTRVTEWPRFIPGYDWLVLAKHDWTRRYVVKKTMRIDLRKNDSLLQAEFAKRLKQLRLKATPQDNPFPGIGQRPKKNSYITVASFGILEAIDRKCSLNDPHVDHDHLANARKLIAKWDEYLNAWF